MIAALTRLVKIPSVVGTEEEAQVFVASQYKDLGLEVEKMEVERDKLKSHKAFCDAGLPYENRPNVIGILSGDPNKNSIILNGHVDVVTPEPVDQWQHDPWGERLSIIAYTAAVRQMTNPAWWPIFLR